MKQEETTQALQQNFFQEKSKFEIIEEKLKNTIFGVLNILLKFDDDSFAGEVLSLINLFMLQWDTYGKSIVYFQ